MLFRVDVGHSGSSKRRGDRRIVEALRCLKHVFVDVVIEITRGKRQASKYDMSDFSES